MQGSLRRVISRETEHDLHLAQQFQLTTPNCFQVALSNTTPSSTSTTNLPNPYTQITSKKGNIDEEEESDFVDDEHDLDYGTESNQIPTTKYPERASSSAVPFEPYHMILTKTKVVLTWWKSQKRKIVAQVFELINLN